MGIPDLYTVKSGMPVVSELVFQKEHYPEKALGWIWTMRPRDYETARLTTGGEISCGVCIANKEGKSNSLPSPVLMPKIEPVAMDDFRQNLQ